MTTHAELAVSRLVGQYRNSPKFRAWVAAVCESFDDIQAALDVVAQLDDLDAVKEDGSYLVGGVNLDVIGKRIGQSRRIPNAIPRLLFGWDDDPYALAFGEENDPSAGGDWYEEGGTNNNDALLDDTLYRAALRGKILLNSLKLVTADDVYTFLQFVMSDHAEWGVVPFVVTDLGGMCFAVEIRRIPTLLQAVLLVEANLMPRPAGVTYPVVTAWDARAPTFGFDDDTLAAGFGEETDPTAGGIFAEEIII